VEVLDRHPEILELVAADLIDASVAAVGRTGLSAESVLRCLVLRQQLGFSYEQLAFHLSDSVTYRTFARLPAHLSPSRSCLQATIRSIQPETLAQALQVLTRNLMHQGVISMDKLRIDSTVVASHIAPPSDSHLLNDGVRVISRKTITPATRPCSCRFWITISPFWAGCPAPWWPMAATPARRTLPLAGPWD
jgi:IS5 family transposase